MVKYYPEKILSIHLSIYNLSILTFLTLVLEMNYIPFLLFDKENALSKYFTAFLYKWNVDIHVPIYNTLPESMYKVHNNYYLKAIKCGRD